MFWSNIFADSTDYGVWDDRPGGSIVDRYERNNVKYVVVVFEKSPDKRYIFIDSEG